MDAPPQAAWDLAAGLPDRPGATELSRLRATIPEVSAEQWREVVTQTLLRRRARSKLGEGPWWLTEAGLQQASRPAVAVRRAGQLRDLGLTEFVDLGCGLGIDSVAAARAGLSVTAVEQDPVTASCAELNLARFAPDGSARIVRADARHHRVPSHAVAFVDPGRRTGSHRDGSARRSRDPQDWHPPWSWLQSFAELHPRTVAKVAPGIDRDLPPPARRSNGSVWTAIWSKPPCGSRA